MIDLPDYVSEDQEGNVHVDIPKLLAHFGWPDTPKNRDMACLFVAEAVSEALPGVAIVKTTRSN